MTHWRGCSSTETHVWAGRRYCTGCGHYVDDRAGVDKGGAAKLSGERNGAGKGVDAPPSPSRNTSPEEARSQ